MRRRASGFPGVGTSRRDLLATGFAAGSLALLPRWPAHAQSQTTAHQQAGFGYGDVRARAAELAEAGFTPPARKLPDALKSLSYDALRDIRFRKEAALWRDTASRFQVQFFHQGFLFDRGVKINEIVDGVVTPVAYRPDMFDFGSNEIAPGALDGLDFAGFRLHYPLNRADYFDELAVFLGASYFRLLGRNQKYGLSARGLAIDPAMPRGEEFPAFREFWLKRPVDGADTLTLFALLDSESATGAFRFEIQPGTTTVADIRATIYPRRDIDKLALAPLTSMFLNGENQRRVGRDFRPEVHDSDGLSIHRNAGEWLWRPLVNPRQLQISSFTETTPRGFGLLQRDRAFASYQDLEAHYQDRPSLWVEPLNDWGPGRVELLEIPTEEEINDNIVAYWVPAQPVVAGVPLEYAYRLHCFSERAGMPPGGRVVATRRGRAGAHGQQSADERESRFVIDFAGGELGAIGDGLPVEAIVSGPEGAISNLFTQRNPEIAGWRTAFDYRHPGRPADLRCFLKLRDDALTETWTYTVR